MNAITAKNLSLREAEKLNQKAVARILREELWLVDQVCSEVPGLIKVCNVRLRTATCPAGGSSQLCPLAACRLCPQGF